MDILSLYEKISNWLGWPITFIVFLGITAWGYWLLNNRLSQVKEHNNILEKELEELQNYRPDIVATRLAERHKQLTDVVELLNDDLQKNREEIKRKEIELEQTREEINVLLDQLEKANIALRGEFPRGGKISTIVFKYLVQGAQIHSALYVPLRTISEVFDGWEVLVNRDVPYKLIIEGAMSKLHIGVETSKGGLVAEVINPFDESDIYDKDFKETLFSVIFKFRQAHNAGLPSFAMPEDARIVPATNIENQHESDWFLVIPITLNDIMRGQ